MRINVSISRRAAVAGVAALATGGAGAVTAGRGQDRADRGVITVPGESPTSTNIPTAGDPRAAGGAHLALTTRHAPPERGWFARYEVDVPAPGGVHRLVAVVTAPVERRNTEETGSYFGLAVNDGPDLPVALGQPHWYESPPAWGALARCTLGDVELRGGRNALTFTVREPTALTDGRLGYRFLLDEFTLTPVPLALREIALGDPAVNLGVHRPGPGGPARLRFRLNGRTPAARALRYRIVDHRAARVASGTATVPAGSDAITVPLPELPPGNYRVTTDEPGGPTGFFAVLPEGRPAEGSANRFGVNVFSFALVPPARLRAVAAGMRQMGVGWVRDGSSWPAAQPEPGGRISGAVFEDTVRAFQGAGLRVLEVVSPPPEWALTETSVPLPADLRDAYRYTARLAAADALQLSNEPDVDDTASTGDQQAAYVKAAALGAATARGAARRPVLLPGIAQGGVFQELMLANDVVRYADVWSFHGYPPPGEGEPEFPSSAEDQRDLREAYGAGSTPMWMTECGAFLPAAPGADLSHAWRLVQARYLVLSTVESLAAGTERQFWFCGPPCTDDGVSFALLSRDFQPWPAYSAYAALTALLGRADFVGMAELGPDAAGFVFGDDDRTVTVVYAPGHRRIEVPTPGRRVEVHDLMGAHRDTLTPSRRGTVRPRSSRDPFYLVADAAPPPTGCPVRPPVGRRFSAAEHIVLNQRFAARHAAPNKAHGDAEPPLGYRLDPTTRLTLEVYNFDDAPRTVTVTARAPSAWSVRPARRADVAVPARGRVALDFTCTASADARPGSDHRLAFDATLDGERVPPSVSLIQLVR